MQNSLTCIVLKVLEHNYVILNTIEYEDTNGLWVSHFVRCVAHKGNFHRIFTSFFGTKRSESEINWDLKGYEERCSYKRKTNIYKLLFFL